MTMLKWFGLTFIILNLVSSNILASDDAMNLLAKSDESRGGLKDGLEWRVVIKSVEDGEENEREFFVRALGNDSIAEATSPQRNKGEIFLFNDRTMWFFKPGLKKPVSISARQRLNGQAANGDIATTNYARDYEPKIEGEEKIGKDITKVLILKSKGKNTTYDQIRYWISTKSFLALKAEFLTQQGKVFKTATFEYGNKINYRGRALAFINKMTIVDELNKENKSILVYGNPKLGKFSDSIFNVNNLAR